MKKLLLGTIAILSLAGAASALAADLPAPVYKAPVMAPVLAYDWTGFYIGANAGYSWGQGNTDFSETTSGTTVVQVFRTAGPNLISTVTTPIAAVTGAGSDRANINGWLAGGQAGYNWQRGTWVFGLEGDFQGTGQRGTSTICLTAGCPIGSIFGSASYKLPWFATGRGRVGVTWDRALFYVTGGLAVAEVETDYAGGLGGGPIATMTTNPTRLGYAVGGGVEGALGNNWTAKLEALYMDFGSFDTAFAGVTNTTVTNALNTPATGFNTVTTTTATTTGNFHSHVSDFIVRVGLNYRFGGPVVANY
jgi:outer membrane immunogenic protein